MTAWHDEPLRDGEYDVPVMFRVTASSASVAREQVAQIVERDQFEKTIVPMYVAASTRDERHATIGLGVVMAYAGEVERLGERLGGIGDLWTRDPEMFRALKDAGQALRDAGRALDAAVEARV